MIKEFFVSFKENIKSKSANPFFGTLIIIWLIKNWNLIYTIFNFDENTLLVEKRKFIIEHFTQKPFFETLMYCVFHSLIIIIISYFLINFTRLIINLYEKQLTPLVYKLTDSKSIVLKSVYDKSQDECKRLEKRLDEERESKLKLQEEYDKLDMKISNLLLKGTYQDEKQKEFKSNPESYLDKRELMIYENIQDKKMFDDYKNLGSQILSKMTIDKRDKVVQRYLSLGLIEIEKQNQFGTYFKFTPSGKNIYDQILIDELKK